MKSLFYYLLPGLLLNCCTVHHLMSQATSPADDHIFDSIRNQIRSMAAGKSIVFLGEPTHGEGNVMAYNSSLAAFLHDSLQIGRAHV